MTRFTPILTALTIGFVLTQTSVQADEKGAAIFANAKGYMAATQSFLFESEIEFKASFNGQPEGIITDYTVAVTRPNNVAVTLNNREMNLHFYSDGTTTTRYLPDFKQYMQEPVATSPSDALRHSSFAVIDTAIMVLSELLKEAPFESIKDATYVATETVDGKKIDQIKIDLNDTGASADIWIEQSDTPIVVKVQPDMSSIITQMIEGNPGLTDVELEVVAKVKDWVINEEIDALLAFNPSEDARKVPQFDLRPPAASLALLGKPAPKFKLDLIDGGVVDIAAKTDEEVIVLDFWATWCVPCRIAMPILEKVTNEFEDQGVTLYAINVEEELEDVQEFLVGLGVDVKVAIDPDSTVVDKYLVDSYPQSIMIGKDGTVQVVHAGISRIEGVFESELREQLTALVKGETLAD
jgi:thiol-disulfide isomerase/thioredoxin